MEVESDMWRKIDYKLLHGHPSGNSHVIVENVHDPVFLLTRIRVRTHVTRQIGDNLKDAD